jgi:hypothetical protein
MRKARIDRNHGEIVQALRQVGASVTSTARVGRGFPDIVVGFRGQNYLLEIKQGKGLVRAQQAQFFNEWAGKAHVVRSVDDALKAIGAA